MLDLRFEFLMNNCVYSRLKTSGTPPQFCQKHTKVGFETKKCDQWVTYLFDTFLKRCQDSLNTFCSLYIPYQFPLSVLYVFPLKGLYYLTKSRTWR